MEMRLRFVVLVGLCLVLMSPNSYSAQAVKKQAVPQPAKSAAANGACNAQSAEKSVHLSSTKFWKLLQKRTVTLYIIEMEKCFVNNQKISIMEKKGGDFTYWHAPRGTAIVRKVENITYADYRKREYTETTAKDLAWFKNRIMSITGKKDSELNGIYLKAVTIQPDKIEDSLNTYGSPRNHPAAKSLKRSEFTEALNSGKVYDIRPVEITKKFPLKKSKSLTYGDYSAISREILSPEQMKKRGIRIRSGQLPKKKSEPVYIISACDGEFAGYNTLTLLASMGYSNIGWFPGGAGGYGKKHQVCLTPDKSNDATIVTASKVKELMGRNDTVIFDVRSEQRFALAGAMSFPYPEKRNALNVPVYRKDVTLAGLKSHKEVYNQKFDISQKSSIIIVGDNEFDWRAYKAAIYLRSIGYSYLYWYRAGMSDWAQKVLVHPEEYKLNVAVKNGDLY